MPTSAVTLEEAKNHLRITGTENDGRIGQMIEAAEQFVTAFIGYDPIDTDGRLIAAIRQAILQQIGFYYDGTPVDHASLLGPYRTWAT